MPNIREQNEKCYREILKLKNCYEIISKYKDSSKLMISETNGSKITYKEFFDRVDYLASLVTIKNENIGIIGYPLMDTIVALFAVWKSGNTAVLISPTVNENELERLVEECDINNAISIRKLDFQSISKTCKVLECVMNTDNNKGEIQSNEDEKIFYTEIALMIPTSGTTSNQKIVCISHKSMICQVAHYFQTFLLEEGVRELIIGPLSSVSNISGLMLPTFFKQGVLSLYNEVFNPRRFLECLNKFKINFTGITPSLLKQMLILKKEELSKLNLIDGICLGGETINSHLITEFVKIVPQINIIPMYGLTETGGPVTGWQKDTNLTNFCVGRLYPGVEVKIVKMENFNSECDQGEIYLSKLPLFSGYYKNEEETVKVFDNGWFKTGDIGYIDDKGYLYIKGRVKNIIIVGGNNVLAEEIEDCLMTHPAVEYAIVYPIKNAIYGEVPAAEVVLKKKIGNVEKELREWCQKRLEFYKIPKKIMKRENINLVSFGKKSPKS